MLFWGALVLSYGVFDEITQPFFGRRCDVYDLLANLVGIYPFVGETKFILTPTDEPLDDLHLY